MNPVRIGKCLLLLIFCVPGALCEDADNVDEPAVTEYFFNKRTPLTSGEEPENITQQVFASNTRGLFPVSNNEYIASCGGMSTSEKTVWQNSDYPNQENLPGLCFLNLLPPAGTCALKIYFDDLDLLLTEEDYYYYGDDCPPLKPFFKASTPSDLTAVYCHKMNRYEGILPVTDTTEPTILLLQLDPSAKFKFKVSITAVNCNDIKTYESPSDCGIKNQDLASLRSELFGDLASEQTQDPVVAEYGDHMPLAYRQRRRLTADSDSLSKDQKNKNKDKNKNSSNDNKKTGTESNQQKYKKIIHPLVEEFKKVIAAAEAAGKISKPSNRVKGKQTTVVNEYPWIVLIEKYNEAVEYGPYEYSCNGLLLDNSRVLTSRYCVLEDFNQEFGVEHLSVKIGDHDLSTTTETKSKTVTVSKVTMPLKNTIYGLKDAFAILHLKEEVQLSDTIRPICLPVSYNSFDDSGVVAGWEIGYSGPSDLPNEAKVKVLDQSSCKKSLEDYWYYLEILDEEEDIGPADVVCAENSKTGTGIICYEDDGHSLTQRDRRGAYYVTGVSASSEMQNCYFRKLPSIFSKIEADSQFLNIALA